MTTINPTAEVLAPPTERYTLLGWLRKNLFRTWYDSLLTLVTLFIAYAILKPTYIWATTEARWEVVPNNLRLFMVGTYPLEQTWRVWLCLYLVALIGGMAWATWSKGRSPVAVVLLAIPLALALLPFSLPTRGRILLMDVVALVGYGLVRWKPATFRRLTVTLILLYLPLVILIVRGLTPEGGFMPAVSTKDWGGLLLTVMLAIVGIVFSFPLGVLLALGRQSKMPAIHAFSVLYIELVRGVPLVTVLFMAQVMLPLFLPANMTVDRILRAMVGFTLFSAAYLAENVRGGLQAISRGQFEAAYALGLNGFQTMIFIILPQALRNVIPVLVGQFIGLFKDTTLVYIVGLLDLLGIANSVVSNPKYLGTQREAYLFIALIYWVFSYAMSYASRRLEIALGVGER